MFSRVCAGLLLAVVGGCGSSDRFVTIGEPDITQCKGASCWDCTEIAIANGTRTVCEKTMSDDVPDSYDCMAGDPSNACPPASIPSPVLSGASSSEAEDGTPKSDAGAPPVAGPFHCEKNDATVRCESSPSCSPNCQPTSCGGVPNGCSACTCPNGPGNDDHDDDDDDDGKDKDKDKDKDGKGKGKK